MLNHQSLIEMTMSKMIFENGRVKEVSDDYQQHSTLVAPNKAIVVATSFDAANQAADLAGVNVAPSIQQTVETVNAPAYTNNFGASFNGMTLLNNFATVFGGLRAPIGLTNKLTNLQGWAIHIKVDDSGSMAGMCANGKTRWENVRDRLILLMKLIQLVPTSDITIDFLDVNDPITLRREGLTPEQFFANAKTQIINHFNRTPNGTTPIFRNVKHMLETAGYGTIPTACYLFTDGDPNEYEKEEEVRYIKNLLMNRANPHLTPFTFLCCSDDPSHTLWMHEIEDEACRPGKAGFVAALQNFFAEQLEVLNDQGPEFPYSEALWLLCNLLAAMDPNMLDALDQHAPLSKPVMDDIAGRELTLVEYQSYFNQHPNANWLFGEVYNEFLTTRVTSQIERVGYFETVLAQQIDNDINSGNTVSEPRAVGRAEEAVIEYFNLQRPPVIRQARANFWQHCYQKMESHQLSHTNNFRNLARQDLWGDYVAASRMQQPWNEYVGQFQQQRPLIPESVAQQAVADDGTVLPPPSYAQAAVVSDYAHPAYHHSYIPHVHIPSVTQQEYSSTASSYNSGSTTGSYGGAMFQQQQPQQLQQAPQPQAPQYSTPASSYTGYTSGSSTVANSNAALFQQQQLQQQRLQQQQQQRPAGPLPPAPCCNIL
jgi:hypothetical protein